MHGFISALFLAVVSVNGATLLSYQAAPALNPLKGWVPYQNTAGRATFTHSLSMMYFSMRELMAGSNTFTWTTLDTQITGATNEGCQFILRVYLNFPTRTTGIPQFLLDGGLTTYAYSDFGNSTSVSPDWENPSLRYCMTNLIAAMGARYDSDPRIAAVELGFLGLWGQWWDQSTAFASAVVQQEIVQAHTNYFTHTKLLFSPNAHGTASFGFYDDAVCTDTLSPFASGFAYALTNFGALSDWKTNMIGGEVDPAKWYCMWTNPACVTDDISQCITNMHFSWIMNSGVFSTSQPLTNSVARARAIAAAQLLGYELYVKDYDWALETNQVKVNCTITNTGVAPFYYPWVVQLKADAQTWNTSWDLRPIQPGTATNYSVTLTNLLPGPHALAMKVVNPMANGVQFSFANTAQDTNTGWLSLGSIGLPILSVNILTVTNAVFR